ncbi:MAG: hypothetical protein IPO00_03370 [Betaproteobacteria bacterium]|nr:hypothetical protein [Betaproteobacteria bacterium]
MGGTGGAVTAFNADANSQQLRTTETKLTSRTMLRNMRRRGIGLANKAEARLTQQAMQQTDSAQDERLGLTTIRRKPS